MDNMNQNPQQPAQNPQPVQYPPYYYSPAPVVKAPPYPTGKRELIFGCLIGVFSLLLCNAILFGGFNLGFAVAAVGSILCSTVYLCCSSCRPSGYSAGLLTLSLLTCAGFARSDDGFVKFVMICFVLLAVNLALGLQAGQNRYHPAGLRSLGDSFRIGLGFSLGKQSPALRGVRENLHKGSPAVKKTGAVLVGLGVSIPLLMVLIPLLMSADAAFDGLVNLIPRADLGELIATVIFGAVTTCLLYARGVALRHEPKGSAPTFKQKNVSHLTINTVLSAVCVVYVAYLLSQLAYFVGGFSGILPEGFTAAKYARRGFFEMAMLCMIDLGVIAVSVGIVAKKEGKAPVFTRILCLFIGLVTIFLVVTASAKMGLYISSFGLTRLRVLTEVIMVFLGLATAVVCLWLFVPRMPYMKMVLFLAMTMGVLTLWVDVDTVVAAYNVSAYESGALKTVDVSYLNTLSDGAIPYIARLTEADDPKVAQLARVCLENRDERETDLRSWNYATAIAEQCRKGS